MRSLRIAPALAVGALACALMIPASARSQDDAKAADSAREEADRPAKGDGFGSLEELHAHYDKQAADLELRRLEDLAKLAASETGDEAESVYQEVFNLAVARDLYDRAEEAAEGYLEDGQGDPYLRGMATFINVIAQADRGEYDQSLEDLEAFLKAGPADKRLEPNTIFSVGEAFLQRLIRSGRYDVARQVCELFVNNATDQGIKEHFGTRLARIGMLGQDAPPILGVDLDGNPISLAEMKGKVVLVDFWATWCPPCVAEIPNLGSLLDKYGEKGFTILGVNLDAAHPDVQNIEKALPIVRQFLVNFRVDWPNVLNSRDGKDYTKAYGVTEIPARFLIGRDGKIIHVELGGEALDKAIAQAVGEQEATAASAP